jgi:hypothetical protein
MRMTSFLLGLSLRKINPKRTVIPSPKKESKVEMTTPNSDTKNRYNKNEILLEVDEMV